MKAAYVMLGLVFLAAFAAVLSPLFIEKPPSDLELAIQARETHKDDIRTAVNECLSSIRNNPQVQHYNDDNEIVESCTEYGMKLYGAHYSFYTGRN